MNHYEVEKIENDLIVDTCGAGDAFVGGFLSQFYQDEEIETCVIAGIYLSREIVQRSGCKFPERFEFSK